jgi:hypothetical protein
MANPPPAGEPVAADLDQPLQSLGERLESLGRALGEREATHRGPLDRARSRAEKLRGEVQGAIERFHAAASAAGASHLRIEVSPVRLDDKHLRSVEFELQRGRHRALIIVKSKGEFTLVGPFRAGKVEGPCLSFPFDAEDELAGALTGFLESFLEEAAAP